MARASAAGTVSTTCGDAMAKRDPTERERRRLLDRRAVAVEKLARHRGNPRGWSKVHQITALDALAHIDAQLARLGRAGNEESNMVEPSTPGPGMQLTVAISFNAPDLAKQLGLRGSLVPRGTVVPVELLAGMCNASALISAGVLKWSPPSLPRVPAAAVPAPKPTPVAVVDHVAVLRAALKPYLDAGRPLDIALDLVDQALVLRAQTQHAHRKGQGAFRRTVDGFREALRQGA
jgi:hypothetical protein